jgi:transmembrane sensor
MSDDETNLDEAIAWHIRLHAGDTDESAWLAFTVWLEADPANRAAYDQVEDMDIAVTPAERAGMAMPEFRRTVPAMRRGWFATGALLAASLLIAIGIATLTRQPSITRYATVIGETKRVLLADGSDLTLNTGTILDVAVDGRSRRATLQRGEVLFHVAKDAAHPFVVIAGDRAVHVIGTVFDVLRDAGTVTVVVAEGKVAVSQSGPAGFSEIHLTPGQRATGREGNPFETVEPVNAAQAIAWQQGFLVYDNAPLARVIADLNRYFPVPITLADDGIAARRFSGVLRIDNENAVVARIAQFLPIRSERTNGGIILRAARKPD